ncbi:hypothetical protein Q0F99_01125 [Rathayibacter oskolensis]|nr:hypothetical protein [Rathayibacter oskolensis]WKK73437.1 hypothetical protein Q0F99_01125 [Rathayibacter oskolensis]
MDPLLGDPQQLDDAALRERADRDDRIGAAGGRLVGDPPEHALHAREELRQIAVLQVEDHLHVALPARGVGQRHGEGEVEDLVAPEQAAQPERAECGLEHPDRPPAMPRATDHAPCDHLGHALAESAGVLGDERPHPQPLLSRARHEEAGQRPRVGLAAAHPARIDGEHGEGDGEVLGHGVHSRSCSG